MNPDPLPLADIHAYARVHANSDGLVATPVPGLRMMCMERPGPKLRSTYRPLVCLVLQGAKHLQVGRHEVVCRQGQSVIVSADMPVTGQVVEATASTPYLALALDLDLGVLSEQAEQLEQMERLEKAEQAAQGAQWGSDPRARSRWAGRTLFTQPTSNAVLDCGRRLLLLLQAREAIPFLLDGLRREMQYWLLTGPNGEALRALASTHSVASRLTPAVALLQSRFREPIMVEHLAQAAAMSRAVFHRHFKLLTSITPVQYQKRLRLIEARRLLRHEAASATRAAYEVGYESVPQFTRDYNSMFGITPGRDRGPLARPGQGLA